ncbi:hotdog family protein [Falsiroseomonas ponticola]|uniref:hypothetical protein n=1 Tax=Falsiroseomonas ponticola TaxID=2786951 RepID=UPI001932ED6B|nr:hypothetical protein [Roseomonas ponticola]
MQGVSETMPVEVRRRARLDSTLAYGASMHDEEAARRRGFAGAIIPGVYAHSFMTQLVVAGWGLDWLRRGTMFSRSRRPLYDGEEVTVAAGQVVRGAAGLEVDLVVRNAAGEDAAIGRATLPDAPPPPPDLATLPVLPIAAAPPEIGPGDMKPGMRYGTLDEAVTPDYFRQSLLDFDETEPAFGQDGIIHPGLLLRLSFRDTMNSYRARGPGLYVSSDTQFHGLLHVGERLTSSAIVVDAYERKGNHYAEIDQVLIADGRRVVARMRRHSIYALRG